MENCKVSIGVPVYNAARYIERCVRSILSQSYDNLDIVFVDDCSTDNSVTIIEQTLCHFPNRKEQVRILHHKVNQGVSAARNTLLSTFTGEFFSFVDADDYLTPNAIELLIKRQRINNSDIVTGNIFVEMGDRTRKIEEPVFENADDMLLHIVSQFSHHSNWARIFKTSIIKENKISYNPVIKIGEDWLFLVEYVLFASQVAKVDDTVYVYDYTNETSAMHQIIKNDNIGNYLYSDLVVLNTIKLLVSNKGTVYVNAVEKLIAKRLEEGLLWAYKNNHRLSFSKFKKYIYGLDKENVPKFFLFRKLSIGRYIFPESYSLYFMAKKIKTKIKNYRTCYLNKYSK